MATNKNKQHLCHIVGRVFESMGEEWDDLKGMPNPDEFFIGWADDLTAWQGEDRKREMALAEKVAPIVAELFRTIVKG